MGRNIDFSVKHKLRWPEWRPTEVKRVMGTREQGNNVNLYVISRKELMDNETNISEVY